MNIRRTGHRGGGGGDTEDKNWETTGAPTISGCRDIYVELGQVFELFICLIQQVNQELLFEATALVMSIRRDRALGTGECRIQESGDYRSSHHLGLQRRLGRAWAGV